MAICLPKFKFPHTASVSGAGRSLDQIGISKKEKRLMHTARLYFGLFKINNAFCRQRRQLHLSSLSGHT